MPSIRSFVRWMRDVRRREDLTSLVNLACDQYGRARRSCSRIQRLPYLLVHRKCSSMNPNKALWEKGDFTRIAATMRESGEALVQRLGITKGLRVLDLGCGDGTTALPAAKLGADVLGVDIARNLVEAGNKRA